MARKARTVGDVRGTHPDPNCTACSGSGKVRYSVYRVDVVGEEPPPAGSEEKAALHLAKCKKCQDPDNDHLCEKGESLSLAASPRALKRTVKTGEGRLEECYLCVQKFDPKPMEEDKADLARRVRERRTVRPGLSSATARVLRKVFSKKPRRGKGA